MKPGPQALREAKAAEEISAEIHKLLAGRLPEVQSAILADCLALWLAGHRGPTRAATDRLRAELLAVHLGLVNDLIEINNHMLDCVQEARKARDADG